MQIKIKSCGYTLPELLITLSVGSLIIIGALSFFMVTGQFGSEQLQRDRLNGKLSQLATVISRELARAGFCYNCSGANPFRLQGKDGALSNILLDDSSNAVQGSCVRFAYNSNKRDGPTAVAANDAKGFRLGKNASGAKTIEIYENYNMLSNWNCTGGYWQDMVDSKLTINDFSLQRTTLQAGANKVQKVVVTISAFLTDAPSITDSVQFTVTPNNIDG